MRAWVAVVVIASGCAGDPAGTAPDGSDAAGDSTGDSGAGPDSDTDAAPDWASDMAAGATDFYVRVQADGAVELGHADPDAGDGVAARIAFAGDPALSSADRVSPAFASELATTRADFHYGTYRARVKLAACGPGEEAVNGIFTYFHDGADHNGDGLDDNAEIDIEILCGTPHVAFFTVWTDYDFVTERFRKWTRAIDFATGDVWGSVAPDRYGIERLRTDATLVQPALLSPGSYVDLGFEWRRDRVRFFATVDGAERTLVELDDPDRIPRLPGHLMFNVWHPAEHWFGGAGAADHPADDAVMLVDRAAYWK